MRQLMSGENESWRDAVYYTYYEFPSVHMVKRHYGVATHRYKLIHFYYDNDEWELYDLKSDPHEMTNVYNNPAYTDVKEVMHQKLDSIRSHYGDSDALNQKFLEAFLDNN
jgi:arylsulfatase A-like enzyme